MYAQFCVHCQSLNLCRTSDGKPTNKIGIEKSYQSQKTIKTASYDVAKGTTAMDQCDRGWRKISGKGELNKKKRGGSRCFVPFGGREGGWEGVEGPSYRLQRTGSLVSDRACFD